MAESKAVPLNVVVSDKGQKSVRIGKAFVNLDGNVPVSLIVSMEALNSALKDKVVTETKFEGNPKYPDPILDGKMVLRIVGFKMNKN
jgi:hypothetical protein